MGHDVPYQQLSTLLAYLKATLRADPVLLRYFGSPGNIVSHTLEHDPLVADDKTGQPRLFRTELPCLAVWEYRSQRIRASRTARQGLHKRWGELVTLRCVYAHKVFHAGAGQTPEGKAARLSKLVEWQMREHLEAHRFDGLDESFDLLTDGKIESIDMGDVTRLPTNKQLDGFATEFTMCHYSAPYEEVSPMALQLIDLELHLDDVVPAVDGPIVEGSIEP